MAEVAALGKLVVWWGFGLGSLLGFVTARTGFCTMGAVADAVNMGDWGRMRSWLLAIAVAVIGTNGLAGAGLVDTTRTIYASPNLPWLAHLVGGLLFGVGMTLASGCGAKTLVRIGGGNLKSLVVFVFMAYAAQATLHGVFAPLRISLLQAAAVTASLPAPQTLPHLLGHGLGVNLALAQGLLALAIGGALAGVALADHDFRTSRDNVLAGLAVGAIVVAGWYITGHVGFAEDPESLQEIVFGTHSKLAESMSFVAPVAHALALGTLWTDTGTVVTWGIAVVFGVVAGAFLSATTRRAFRWEYFVSGPDMLRHMGGAVLMGFGGVCALGCTFGQGITGISTLALSSLLTLAAIVAGAAATMKYEYWRMSQEG